MDPRSAGVLLSIPEFKGATSVLHGLRPWTEFGMARTGRPRIGIDLEAVTYVGGAALIPLRHSPKKAIVDEADLPLLAPFTWREHHQGYAQAAVNGKQRRIQDLLLDRPQGMEIDHINRNRLDNRRCNLRVVTREQNMRNKGPRRDCRSGIKGVYRLPSGKWAANIRLEGKGTYLGSYVSKEEAAEVRMAAEILRGDHD